MCLIEILPSMHPLMYNLLTMHRKLLCLPSMHCLMHSHYFSLLLFLAMFLFPWQKEGSQRSLDTKQALINRSAILITLMSKSINQCSLRQHLVKPCQFTEMFTRCHIPRMHHSIMPRVL